MKGLEALERLKKVKVEKETPVCATFLVHDKRYCDDLSIIEKELKALEIIGKKINATTLIHYFGYLLDEEDKELLKEVLYGKETS